MALTDVMTVNAAGDLVLSGGIIVGPGDACGSSEAGAIRWNNGRFEVCTGETAERLVTAPLMARGLGSYFGGPGTESGGVLYPQDVVDGATFYLISNVTGCPWYDSDGGVVGDPCWYTGCEGHAKIYNLGWWTPGESLTLQFWAKFSGLGLSTVDEYSWFAYFNGSNLMSRPNITASGPGTIKMHWTSLGSAGGIEAAVIDDGGTWNQVVMVYDAAGESAGLYVNGLFIGSEPIASYRWDGSSGEVNFQFEVGSSNWDGYDEMVSMDEVALWNRVLTADEIAMLYNAGEGWVYPFN